MAKQTKDTKPAVTETPEDKALRLQAEINARLATIYQKASDALPPVDQLGAPPDETADAALARLEKVIAQDLCLEFALRMTAEQNEYSMKRAERFAKREQEIRLQRNEHGRVHANAAQAMAVLLQRFGLAGGAKVSNLELGTRDSDCAIDLDDKTGEVTFTLTARRR